MSEIGTGLQNATGIRNGIARAGYAFVEASDMRAALGRFGTLADWPAFARSWNDLLTDTYMADGGRYRRRRFGVWTAAKQGMIERGAHQPHYQGLDYCRALFGRLAPETERWHIEVHQFRIEARRGEDGKPTPEGMHRDGVDY